MKYQEEEVSCYQETSLEAYLNAMFHYYEAQGVAQEVRSVDKEAVKETKLSDSRHRSSMSE